MSDVRSESQKERETGKKPEFLKKVAGVSNIQLFRCAEIIIVGNFSSEII